jgi:hypothetical protein
MPPLKGETYLIGLKVMRLPTGIWAGESMAAEAWDAVRTGGAVTRATALGWGHLGSEGSLSLPRFSVVWNL